MVPRRERIGRRQFPTVRRAGRTLHSPHFALSAAPAPRRAFAAVVSKKVARTAVSRNRLRRRLYHILRAAVPAGAAHTLVITAKAGAAALPAPLLYEEIRALVLSATKSLPLNTVRR